MRKIIVLLLAVINVCFATNFEIVNKTKKDVHVAVANNGIMIGEGLLLSNGDDPYQYSNTIDPNKNTVLYVWKNAYVRPVYEKWYPGKKMPKNSLFIYKGFPVNQNGIKGNLHNMAPKVSPKPDHLYIFKPGKQIIINVTETGIVPQKGSGIRNKKSQSGESLSNNISKVDIKKVSVPAGIEYKPSNP